MPPIESPNFPSVKDFSPPMLESPTSSIADPTLTAFEMDANISSYFEYFHPCLPILHQPTIGAESPEILKNIVVAIGGLYRARKVPKDEASGYVQKSQAIWHGGWKELNKLVSNTTDEPPFHPSLHSAYC